MKHQVLNQLVTYALNQLEAGDPLKAKAALEAVMGLPPSGATDAIVSQSLVDSHVMAETLGVSVRHLRTLVATKRIPSVCLGRARRFSVRSVLVALQEETPAEQSISEGAASVRRHHMRLARGTK